MQSVLYFIFLSTLSVVVCDKKELELNSIITKNNITDKSDEFLQKIKEDLRRNNDDYAEAMARSITTNLPRHLESNLKSQYKKKTLNNTDFKRRAYESLSEEENSTDPREIETTTKNTTVKRFTKITQRTKLTAKIKNMSKLKMYFSKNNDLLKEFIRNKGLATTTLKINDIGKQNIKMKARENEQEILLPNSEQLDMAPAKGGHVHVLRIKGRLCQRNVLIPEGPKYDSKGNIYLPAFSSAPRHNNFEKTIPPKIILPRCCNCCKKSVLGCE